MGISALKTAIELVGGQTKLASLIGKRQSHIWRWLKSGRVSPDQVLKVEEATGGKVTRYELRPDIYGEDPAKTRRSGRRVA